jgi:hypothetical protein
MDKCNPMFSIKNQRFVRNLEFMRGKEWWDSMNLSVLSLIPSLSLPVGDESLLGFGDPITGVFISWLIFLDLSTYFLSQTILLHILFPSLVLSLGKHNE